MHTIWLSVPGAEVNVMPHGTKDSLSTVHPLFRLDVAILSVVPAIPHRTNARHRESSRIFFITMVIRIIQSAYREFFFGALKYSTNQAEKQVFVWLDLGRFSSSVFMSDNELNPHFH
jgi:hypothetical protein